MHPGYDWTLQKTTGSWLSSLDHAPFFNHHHCMIFVGDLTPPFFTEDSWPSSPPAKAMPSLNSHTAKPAAIHKNAFHPSAFLPKKNLRTKPLHCNAQNLARQLVLFKRKKQRIPSRELTFPTLGKEKSSSKRHFGGNMLVPWRLPFK